jgi:hypothetical protein
MGRNYRTTTACSWALGSAFLLFGCAGSGGKYPVKGELQWENGRPLKELAGYDIAFSSQKLGKSARGAIKDDGTFVLGTDRDGDGAFPADYIVTVTQPHPNPERLDDKRRPVVKLDYENTEKTPLKATVREQDNYFTFKLKPIKSEGS